MVRGSEEGRGMPMMGTADEVLEDVRALLRSLAPSRPLLRAVHLHPDDYAALREQVPTSLELTEHDGMLHFFGGVLVYEDPWVERGKPWYDPPEAGPRRPKAPLLPGGDGGERA